MKKALLICMDHYPNGDAGAVRTHVFAKMMESINYEPTIVGLGKTTNFAFEKYENFSYISLRSLDNDIYSKIKNRLFFHSRLKKYLLDDQNKWDAILFSGVPKQTINVLKKYSKKKRIPLIYDAVEWYSPEQFSIGKLHPAYIANNRLNTKYIDKSIMVVAISSYLENHYSKKKIKTIRIPVVMDMDKISCKKETCSEKVVFLYAGSPGKKDYLDIIISGFSQANLCVPYELKIIGITKGQLVSQSGANLLEVEKLGEHLCCMGRVTRDEVLKQLSCADFTVLMRSEEQRYAKAGFPTKFVESLATGTPVISNATSDLAEYLEDGKNGFLVSECSSQALKEAIQKAIKISFDERKDMQMYAQQSANEKFNFKIHINLIKDLIENNKNEIL